MTPVKPVFVAPVEYSLLILLRLFGTIFSDLDFNQNNFGLYSGVGPEGRLSIRTIRPKVGL